MATVQVTEKDLEKIVERGVVLLDCWTSWRGPWRAATSTSGNARRRKGGG